MIGDLDFDRFDFRPLVRADLMLLADWHAAPHVSRWWTTAADLETEYLTGADGTKRFVVQLDGRPTGLVQLYSLADSPEYASLVGAEPGEVGIDYLLGDAADVGRGVGPAMLAAFLEKFVTTNANVTGVRVDVAEANRRSWRTLEKLGFVRTLTGISVPGEPGPHYVYVLTDRRSFPA
jgi:aminoglycoside 6'-N-acetyltransferase